MAISWARSIRGKFPHVGVGVGPLVYFAEFSDGTVKVGYTGNARARLSLLGTHARRAFQAEVVRFHMSPVFASDSQARGVEARMKELLAQRATPLPHCTEYFRGIAFDDAVQLLQIPAHHEHRDANPLNVDSAR